MNLLSTTLLCMFSLSVFAQTSIPMEKTGGVYKMPCSVNGLKLNFVFDTGASNVSISSTEALFMIKNGYLKSSDFGETINYTIANGQIQEGTKLTLKEVQIGTTILKNVEASVVHSLDAPLLLGQSVLSQFGVIQFNYETNTLKFYSQEELNNIQSQLKDLQSFNSLLSKENESLRTDIDVIKNDKSQLASEVEDLIYIIQTQKKEIVNLKEKLASLTDPLQEGELVQIEKLQQEIELLSKQDGAAYKYWKNKYYTECK